MNEDTTTAPAGSLRLLWPQWQGAGPDSVAALAAELPSPLAHTGYSLGTRILDLLVPDNSQRTAGPSPARFSRCRTCSARSSSLPRRKLKQGASPATGAG